MRFDRLLISLGVAAVLFGCGGGGSGNGGGGGGSQVFMITQADRLIRFPLGSPGSVSMNVPVTGLNGGDFIVGMDFRETDGLLYGLGSLGQLYTINTTTGVATAVGSGTGFTTTETNVAFALNPVVDRYRVITPLDENFRINPNTGEGVDGDVGTGGLQMDAAINPASDISACAYTPNAAGFTTLYAIDGDDNELVMIGGVNGSPSPNLGARTTVGPLGISVAGGFTSLDIMADGSAFLSVLSGGTTTFYLVNLANGATTPIGAVGGSHDLMCMAIRE